MLSLLKAFLIKRLFFFLKLSGCLVYRLPIDNRRLLSNVSISFYILLSALLFGFAF